MIDHIAFLATDPGRFVKHLKEMGVPVRPRSLPESELFQLFIKDPDGLTIELNFFGVVTGRSGLGRRGLLEDAAGAGPGEDESPGEEGQSHARLNDDSATAQEVPDNDRCFKSLHGHEATKLRRD